MYRTPLSTPRNQPASGTVDPHADYWDEIFEAIDTLASLKPPGPDQLDSLIPRLAPALNDEEELDDLVNAMVNGTEAGLQASLELPGGMWVGDEFMKKARRCSMKIQHLATEHKVFLGTLVEHWKLCKQTSGKLQSKLEEKQETVRGVPRVVATSSIGGGGSPSR